MLQLAPIVTHIAGYRFVPVEDTQATLLEIEGFSHGLGILGTVFLASEGINISIAGNLLAVLSFRQRLDQDPRFCNIKFHETYCQKIPYSKLNFKTKKELVPLGVENVTTIDRQGRDFLFIKIMRKIFRNNQFYFW